MNDRKLRVLVVDDERLIADTLAQILISFGYEATAVYNPDHALEQFTRLRFDAVISDVVMRGYMSGIDLAIALRTLVPDCNILLISGNTATEEFLKLAQSQGYDFHVLAKPVHPTEILDRLKTMPGLDSSAG